MKKTIVILLLAAMVPLSSFADEGMWLVNAFERIYPQMKKAGLKLQPGELYNEENPAVCSAVVAMNGGIGTGSVISDKGLVITNHHVAYGDIHTLSTPENNYLEDGFWALDNKDELRVAGASVTFLRKIIDVTDEAIALREQLTIEGKMNVMGNRRIYGMLEKKYAQTTPYEVSCAAVWRGTKYLLFLCETYNDVRLVGAPPVRIGAFGGEQDNWSWPQHKCDFALYRVYADKEGKPAAYSQENVPLKPRKVLNISTSGVQDMDYAMVIGFPGKTDRHRSSFSVNEKQHITNPIIIKARRDRLDIMKKHMEADPKVRLRYSSKYFGLSNYADYAKWENICLRRYDVIGIRAKEEAQLAEWIESDPALKAEYGDLLSNLEKGYKGTANAVREKTYFHETWISPSEVMMTANRLATLVSRMEKEGVDSLKDGDQHFVGAKSNTRKMMKDFNLALDKEVLVKTMQTFTDNVTRKQWGKALNEQYDKYKGDIKAMLDDAYANSCCTSYEKMCAWFKTARSREEILADPMIALSNSVPSTTFSNGIKMACKNCCVEPDKEDARYTTAIYRMREAKGIAQYPDANSTMRISYGTVGPITPSDGVHYDSRSTIKGYLEKYNPEDYEFRVDDRLLSLIAAKDWGRWGEHGQLYTDFLTNNDITGGNSGSPVLNAKGDVIGLAFDGNRESMSGDIFYHPTNSKTVCVDIRFVMWMMEKYAGAGKLIDEMRLVK